MASVIVTLGAIAGIVALNFTPGFQGWRDSTIAIVGGANTDCDASENIAAYYEIDQLFAREAPVAEVHDHEIKPSALAGRVDLAISVRRGSDAPAQDSILVSGTYGAKSSKTTRNFVKDEEAELVPGECATWREGLTVPEEFNGSYVYTVRGAWGERPYCFMALTYPENEAAGWGDVHPSEPYCFVAHWENAWGEMKSPPEVANASSD